MNANVALLVVARLDLRSRWLWLVIQRRRGSFVCCCVNVPCKVVINFQCTGARRFCHIAIGSRSGTFWNWAQLVTAIHFCNFIARVFLQSDAGGAHIFEWVAGGIADWRLRNRNPGICRGLCWFVILGGWFSASIKQAVLTARFCNIRRAVRARQGKVQRLGIRPGFLLGCFLLRGFFAGSLGLLGFALRKVLL